MKRLALTAVFVMALAVPAFAGEVPTVGIVGEVPTVGAVTPQATNTTQTISVDNSTSLVTTILLSIASLIGR